MRLLKSIYDPTEHELVVEARELVKRFNSVIEDCSVTRAAIDGPMIVLEIKDPHERSARELYRKIQKFIDSEKLTIRLAAITVTENLDDYLPRYGVQGKVS